MARNEYGNFIRIFDFMVTGLKLSKIDLLVYAYIFSLSMDGLAYYGSQQFLADRFGTCRKTIAEVLKNLTNKGLLLKREISIPQGKGCEYFIDFEAIEQYHV